MQASLFTILGFMIGVALYASLRSSQRARNDDRRKHDDNEGREMGALSTTVLGIAGSAAGCLASLHVLPYQLLGVQPAGLAASALGACALVLLGDQVVAKRGSFTHAQSSRQGSKQRA
jgi:uncharacterized membrane protein YeaQ/YmgE (transglycosylase-associated protein family)